MKHRQPVAIAITILALPISGCTMSQVDPDADVTISGRALQPDGAPLGNTRVTLLREPDPGELLSAATVVGTLGLACLADRPPPICAGLRSTETDGGGRFVFRMKGRDTRGSIGNASNMHLSMRGSAAPGEVEGPVSTEIFKVQTEMFEPLPLPLWNPRLGLAADAGKLTATMEPFPATGYGELDGIEALFASSRGVVWRQTGFTGPGAAVDARLLEDASGALAVTARAHDTAQGTTVDFLFRAGRIPYTATSGAPPSRGAPVFGHGPEGATPLSAALTDGDLWTAFTPVAEPPCSPDAQGRGCEDARANNWVYVDLGVARPLSLIVVRGECWSCAVDLSTDATSWVVASSGQAGSHPVSVSPAAPAARYVRVRGATSRDRVVGLTEVSAW